MSYYKQIDNLPSFPNAWDELQTIVRTNNQSWHGNQICINTVPGHEDDPLLGVGSLTHNWDKKYTDSDGKIIVPEFENPMREGDFTEICNIFMGTVFEELYNAASTKYDFGRVRIMLSNPKTCLSWHRDTTDRLHYPIKTQEGCLMVIDNEVKHLGQDEWWYTYTKTPHTAFNGSREDRCHIVFTIIGEK